MRYLNIILLIFIMGLSGCSGKDPFKDPSSATGNERSYRVNGKDIKMPLLLTLPDDKKFIPFKFEKPGAKPALINLQYTIDGWKSDNLKAISAGEPAGLIVDFNSGKIYELPKSDLPMLLDTFTAKDITVIEATEAASNNPIYTKLIVVDGKDLYNKDDYKYLTLLNMRTQTVQAEPSIRSPESKATLDKDVVIVGKPVITAAANGQFDRLQKLIKNNANINEIDEKEGDNALMKAIKNGDEDIALFLLDNKINPKYTNFAGQNALHVASDIGFYNLSEKLIAAGNNVNSKDRAGNTPLIYAATSPNPFLAELLIENGAKIDERNAKGETPLMLAALTGNTKTVESLVIKGADRKAQDNDGNDVLMKAVSGGNGHTAKKLLDFGFSPDTPNKNGVRPLHVATRAGFDDIAMNLLEKGADVNAKDSGGNTPLIIAAERGDIPLVEKILEYKPNVLQKNNNDKSAHNIAKDKGYGRIEKVLSDAIMKTDAVTALLFDKVAANDTAGAKLAIERGARVNSIEVTTGNTPIFTSVANNYQFMTETLIKLGANVNHKNEKGNIPLTVAVTSSDVQMVELLIKSGSDLNSRNNNGDTALIWSTKLKRPDMVRALLVGGADPNTKNNDGVSAFLIAYNEGTPEILNLLQAAGGHR